MNCTRPRTCPKRRRHGMSRLPRPLNYPAFTCRSFPRCKTSAKDFYSKFPKDPRALDARIYEFRGTMLALPVGRPDQRIHLDALEKSLTNDPAVTEDDRVKIHNSKLMMLLGVARDSEPSKARPLLKEILSDDPVPEEIKERAAGELSRLESVRQNV